MKTVALAALFVCGASAQQASNFVLVAHSGAGDYSKMTQPVIEARRNGMLQAIQAGYAILAHGGTSIDAVEATIRAMEDSGLYDAGRGAYYTKEGVPEMDAAIMDGRTLQAGSVAALKHIANPIHLARLVMEKTPHVLLVADGAEGSRNRRASNWSRRITSTPSANGTAIKTLRKRSWPAMDMARWAWSRSIKQVILQPEHPPAALC